MANPPASSGRHASTPLFRRLLAMVAAVALPLLLLAAGIAWSQYLTERQREETQLLQQTRGLAQLVDRQFATTEAILRTLASSNALAQHNLPAFAAEMRTALGQLSTRTAQPLAIRLSDAKGELLLDSRGDSRVPQHAIPAAAAAIASGKPQITNLFVGKISNRPVVVVLVPVFAPGSVPGPGKAIGTLGVDLPRQQLLTIIRDAGLPSGGIASVLDRQGSTVVRSAADAKAVGKAPAPAELRRLLGRREGILRDIQSPEGVLATAAFARAPVSGFILKLDVPERLFLAPLHAALLRTAVFGAVMLLVAFGLAALLGRGIARALQRVPGIAAARAQGMTALSTGLREIDNLAAALGETLAERSVAEARLEENEERLRLAVDAAEIGLWDVDPVNDVLYWPPRVKAMFGISADVPVSMADFYAGLHPDDHARVAAAFAIALDPRKRGLYDVEYRAIGKEDKVVRWVAAKGRGIFDDDGRCVRVIGTAIDVSARKAVERQLRELNETLEERVAAAVSELAAAQETLHQAQKIETIGQLTGGVAHDFNNLLTPIFGTLELLHRRLADDKSAQRLTSAALQAAESARTLIQRLLAFSRRQHLEARAVNVRMLVEGLADLASRSLGPQIRLVLRIADGLPPARVDPNQLELALLNLAVNARDAMEGVGTLTLAVSRETVLQSARLGPGDYIRIAVTDTGCGMDGETLKRAVEPFFTTKGVGHGTGLGLSMVHGLAAQSGGSFDLQSTVGAGTTATLWLPVSEEAMLRSRPESAAAPGGPLVAAVTVLLVDDEELVRSTTADMLADAGFIVSEAASAVQALEMLKAGLKPDVLVTDYAMPGMTGGALAREARILRPGLPVLLITGYASLNDRDAGSLPRLSKPFRQADLVAMLGALLEKAGKLPQAVG